jgi:hypothetical protein
MDKYKFLKVLMDSRKVLVFSQITMAINDSKKYKDILINKYK